MNRRNIRTLLFSKLDNPPAIHFSIQSVRRRFSKDEDTESRPQVEKKNNVNLQKSKIRRPLFEVLLRPSFNSQQAHNSLFFSRRLLIRRRNGESSVIGLIVHNLHIARSTSSSSLFSSDGKNMLHTFPQLMYSTAASLKKKYT